MGQPLRMDNINAPTVFSGPTSHAATHGQAARMGYRELVQKKNNLEAELRALGTVLDSVCWHPTQS